jgi:hypothetical protein
MAYETAPTIKGKIYNADIIVTDYDNMLYESVDALLLDIQDNPRNYGITDDVIKVGCKAAPALHAPDDEWRKYKRSDDIVVWVTCDEPEWCGAEYNGEWWCEWHEALTINYTWKDMVTVIK